MPPFQYQDYRNANAGSIADLLLQRGAIGAREAEGIGAARAAATSASGNAWAQAVQAAGQIPAQVLQQRRLDQDAAQKRELQAQQIDTGRTEADARKQATAQANMQRLVTTIGTLAKGAADPEDFAGRVADLAALGALPQETAQHIAQQATDGDWPTVQKRYVDFASQYAKTVNISKGGKIANEFSGATVADNPEPAKPPTVEQMALEATGGDADAALARLRPPPQPTIASLASAARPDDPEAALRLAQPPRPAPSMEEQYLTARVAGNTEAADAILKTLKDTAAAKRDPDAQALARELGGLRMETAKQRLSDLQTAAEPLDISPDVQTTRAGRSYVDLSGYQGKERNKARDAATAAGAIGVSKEQANALQEIDNARLNQQSINDQIADLLPKGVAGRTVAAVTVPLSTLFQTNDQIAAYNSWRTAAIQTLRATAGSKGLRINQAEIAQAIENDIPKLTDTVGTAQQKLKNINTMLDNAEQSILVRDRRAVTPPAAEAPKLTPGLQSLKDRK